MVPNIYLRNSTNFEYICLFIQKFPLSHITFALCVAWQTAWPFLQSSIAVLCRAQYWQPLFKAWDSEKCEEEFGKQGQQKQCRHGSAAHWLVLKKQERF